MYATTVRLVFEHDVQIYPQFSNSNRASFCLLPNDDRDSLLLLIAGSAGSLEHKADDNDNDEEDDKNNDNLALVAVAGTTMNHVIIMDSYANERAVSYLRSSEVWHQERQSLDCAKQHV